MAKITVSIEGISPLIMHAFPLVPVEGYLAFLIFFRARLGCAGHGLVRLCEAGVSIHHLDFVGRHDVRLKRHCALVG
jgi:hypothetical protein